MNKHTPGPWKLERAEDGGLVVLGPHPLDGPVIHANRYGADDPEQEANARLIAAAPDLLEAARDALALLEDWPDAPSSMIRTIRAAIAKAEGAVHA